MRLPTLLSVATFSTLLALSPLVTAIRLIKSNSLNPCQDNSNFTASLFNVVFTPDNDTLAFDVVGVSSIQGNVTAQLEVIAYGFVAVNQTLDPCTMDLSGLCPMSTGQINIESNVNIPKDVSRQIPGIAYGVPDLDGVVRIYIRDRDTEQSLACVEAQLSNGKTVDQKAVGWTTAVIAGLGLIASAVTSGLGHSNTAAHVAANALSLFGFFQAQAIIGMTSVKMPPIVQSWTQNFQWSMGIIRVGFLQSICTWYQRSTGGTPTTYLSTLATTSVAVQKRSLGFAHKIVLQGLKHFGKRTTTGIKVTETAKVIVVRGIDRVGFRAEIEQTNIFLTGFIFFIFFCFAVAILVVIYKLYCEMAVRVGWMKSDTFAEFRAGWNLVLKGILFRLVLIGYPQMTILCLWELIERDSAAEVILGILVFLSMTAALGWASLKVISLARRSVSMHKNPAYILYSDPKCLNRWGFLYIQYRATAYYFVLPVLGYILVKGMFLAFAQGAPIPQAIGLLVIEAVFLVGVSVLRPWMDRKTNIFNISIASVNFINAIFLLIFTSIFNQPGLVTGIMGVVFALINVVFALILLILVLIASVYAIVSKNPDNRYQPMRDDRGSFIKSQAQLTTELDALGATARGFNKGAYGKEGRFDDSESFSSGSLKRQQYDAAGIPLPPSTANSIHQRSERQSPVDHQPMFPGDSAGRRGPRSSYEQQRGMYSQANNASEISSVFGRSPDNTQRPHTSGPTNGGGYNPGSGYNNSNSEIRRTGSSHSYQRPAQFQNSARSSPWQRGAGYEDRDRP